MHEYYSILSTKKTNKKNHIPTVLTLCHLKIIKKEEITFKKTLLISLIFDFSFLGVCINQTCTTHFLKSCPLGDTLIYDFKKAV